MKLYEKCVGFFFKTYYNQNVKTLSLGYNFLSSNRLLYKFNGKDNIKTNEATEPPTVLAINVLIREILIYINDPNFSSFINIFKK